MTRRDEAAAEAREVIEEIERLEECRKPSPLTDASVGALEQSGHAWPLRSNATDALAQAERGRYAGTKLRERLKRKLDLGASVQTVATASSLGDYYQYVIDRPVDLARQKSALLPIVNKDVEGKRVSIYNPNGAAEAPAARAQVQEHDRHAAHAGAGHGLRGLRLRRRHARARSATRRRTARQLRHRSGHRSVGEARQQHVAHHEREGSEGDHPHAHGAATGTRLRRQQPQHDRSHAADRASESQGPGLRVHRRQQAEGRSGRRVPLRSCRSRPRRI